MIETFDTSIILKLLPHRYPFLLVDRITDYDPGKSLTALKNVTFNEHFFVGHFPQKPVMPGVLQLEALAQVTGLLGFIDTNTKAEAEGLYFLAGIDKARFKQIVEPGDQLKLTATVIRFKKGISKFYCEATVDGKVACSAEITTARKDSHTSSEA